MIHIITPKQQTTPTRVKFDDLEHAGPIDMGIMSDLHALGAQVADDGYKLQRIEVEAVGVCLEELEPSGDPVCLYEVRYYYIAE